MSSTMWAYVLHGREDARLEALPIPEPGPGEVRLRIRAALTCGTDLKVFRRGYHARMIIPPAVFGHEMSGEVEAVGAGVEGWERGTPVVAANSAPCGACFFCARHREELCEDLLFLNGAYAEYVVIPERIVRRNLLPLPAALPFAAAALTEPLACAVLAVEATGVGADETVAILGAGPLGLLLAGVCAARGARVLVAGQRPARLRVAAELGAAVFDVAGGDPVGWVRSETQGYGADRVIEAVGSPEAWETAIAMARRGGVVNLFGGCASGTQVTLETARLHYDSVTLMGSFHHTPDTIRRALTLLAVGTIPWQSIVQDRIELSALPARFPSLAHGGGPLKVLVEPADR